MMRRWAASSEIDHMVEVRSICAGSSSTAAKESCWKPGNRSIVVSQSHLDVCMNEFTIEQESITIVLGWQESIMIALSYTIGN